MAYFRRNPTLEIIDSAATKHTSFDLEHGIRASQEICNFECIFWYVGKVWSLQILRGSYSEEIAYR